MRHASNKFKKMMFDMLYVTKSYFITKPIYSGLGTILTFHRVCPKSERSKISGNLRLEITPEYLEGAIKFFASHNYEIISPDRLFEILHSRRIDRKFVVFTFDDGYADNFTYAYPVFKKHNAPFTIYVTTNFPDRKAILWWYLLEDLIFKNERIFIKVDNKTFEFKCSSAGEREKTFYKIRSIIMKSHESDQVSQIQKMLALYRIDIYKKTDKLALSWKQIEQLGVDPLVTIGAHTVNHFPLSKLPESAAKYEIIESKKKLESRINCAVEHFAYPFGTKNEVGERELRIVKECGFKTATTSRQGNIFFSHKDYMQCLPRTIISGEREGENIQYLNLWINGTVSCLCNKFKKVVTL